MLKRGSLQILHWLRDEMLVWRWTASALDDIGLKRNNKNDNNNDNNDTLLTLLIKSNYKNNKNS